MPAHLHTCPDSDELATTLSGQVISCLQAGLDTRGKASLAVSGGSTPVPLFRQLCQTPLAWDKVQITLVDERWLPPDHPDSNANLVKTHLLRHQAARAQWLPLKTDHDTADAALEQTQQMLKALLPFDAVVLGMGKDGHTASFFPDAENLSDALCPTGDRLCAAIESPGSQYPRMTLTLPAVLRSKQIFVHVAGLDKHTTLEQAIKPGAVNELPIRAVLQQNTVPVDIYYSRS